MRMQTRHQEARQDELQETMSMKLLMTAPLQNAGGNALGHPRCEFQPLVMSHHNRYWELLGATSTAVLAVKSCATKAAMCEGTAGAGAGRAECRETHSAGWRGGAWGGVGLCRNPSGRISRML